jgi:hypothetical protein
MRHPFLDYSDRINDGEKVFIDRKAYQKSAEVVCAMIAEHIPFLQRMRRPQDFLRHIEWMMGNSSVNFRFDLALTYCRMGDVSRSRELLRALDVDVDRWEEISGMPMHPAVKPFFDGIKQAAHEVETNPSGLTPLLDEWENQNIEAMGLRPSRAEISSIGRRQELR